MMILRCARGGYLFETARPGKSLHRQACPTKLNFNNWIRYSAPYCDGIDDDTSCVDCAVVI